MNFFLILLLVLGVCSVVFLFLGIWNFFRIVLVFVVVDGLSGDEYGFEYKVLVYLELVFMKLIGGILSIGGGGFGEVFDEWDELEEFVGVMDVEFFFDVDMELDFEGEIGGYCWFDY